MKELHIVSYGAGVDSTAMIFWLLKNKKPIDYVVFSDTGDEIKESFVTLDLMEKFLNKLEIPLVTVKPKNRTLKQRCEDRRVIPDRIKRWCTRDAKITPIFAFYRKLIADGVCDKVNQYLGYNAKEKRRLKPDPKKAPYVHNLYPLYYAGITKQDCHSIIKEAGFPPVIKSGCKFCPHNNLERWFWLWQNYPVDFDAAIAFEEQNKYFPKQKLFQKCTLRELKKLFECGKTPEDVDL